MENNNINKIIPFVTLSIISINALADDSAARIQKLESKLNELESSLVDMQVDSISRKLKITGTLINRYENFFTSTGSPGQPMASDHVAAFTTYFGLNFNTYVTPKIGLFSTLAMSKYWNNEARSETVSSYIDSETGSYGIRGSTPRIDRAYMTYFFDFPMTFTIGRMSTNSGLPLNQLDGLERQGTYPRFALNAIYDGMALTYNFKSYLPAGHDFTARAFYTPYTNISDSDRTKQLQDNGLKVPSNTFQAGLLSEYGITNLNWASKLNLSHFIYKYDNFYYDGINGRPNNSNSNAPKNNFLKGGANMVYVGLENIGQLGLNFSTSGLFYWQKQIGSADPTATIDSKTYHSQAYLFNLNQKFLDNFIIGGEYIKTDENFYLDEWTNLNIAPFYMIPNSKSYHLFFTEKLTKPITIRIGVYHIDSKACSSASANSGAYTNDSKSNSIYTNMRLDF